MRTFIRVIGALAVLSGGVCHAQNAPAVSEPYHVRPVRIIVPFAAGGPGDLISRFMINPSLYGKVPYDPIKDFDPVTIAATSHNVLVSHTSVPARMSATSSL